MLALGHLVGDVLGVLHREGQGGGIAAPGAHGVGHGCAASAQRLGLAGGGVHRRLVLHLGVQLGAHQDHLSRDPDPQQHAHHRRQGTVAVGLDEIRQIPAEQQRHRHADHGGEDRAGCQPRPARPLPAGTEPVDQRQNTHVAEQQHRPAQPRQIGPLVLQPEQGQHYGNTDDQSGQGQHGQYTAQGEGHADQVVFDDVALLDLVIGDVQPIKERLHRPVCAPQRQGQGPDQGEGQLSAGVFGQALHLFADETGHVAGQQAVQELQPIPCPRRVGEQPIDGDERAQDREKRQQGEEGHAPRDKAHPIARVGRAGPPQDVDPSLQRDMVRPPRKPPASRLVRIIVVRLHGLGRLGRRDLLSQVQADPVALGVQQVRGARARRQPAGRRAHEAGDAGSASRRRPERAGAQTQAVDDRGRALAHGGANGQACALFQSCRPPRLKSPPGRAIDRS